MKLTEQGLKNLLESLDTNKVTIDKYSYCYVCGMDCNTSIYIKDKELHYSIDVIDNYYYKVIHQPVEVDGWIEYVDNLKHISLIDLLKELRPYIKKAE